MTRALRALVLLGLLSAACADGPGTATPDAAATPDGPGPAAMPVDVVVGQHAEGAAFRAFRDGSSCPLVRGHQAGAWIMPTVRMRGLDPTASVEVTLTARSGGVLADTASVETFTTAPEAWWEVRELPVRLDGSPEQLARLDGRTVLLEVAVEDAAGRRDSLDVRIVLVDRPPE